MPGARFLIGLMTVAVLLSIVHYTDNYVNWADYPQASSGPSQATVGISWFVFTAFGVAGVVLYLRGRVVPAVACLAAYSVSGLIGIGHFTVEGAADMPWWRQLHVAADIASGVVVVAFAVWALRRHRAILTA